MKYKILQWIKEAWLSFHFTHPPHPGSCEATARDRGLDWVGVRRARREPGWVPPGRKGR